MNQRLRINRLVRTVAAPAWLLLAACSRIASVPTSTPSSKSAQTAVGGVESANGMVVSASAIASKAGRDVLMAGGNAIDAAIATGFALAVTYPTAGNIGGGGFMVVRLPDGRATTIDFREMAPHAATPEMFTDTTGAYSAARHHRSHVAVGVPGTVAGFALAHEKYGKLPWKQLVAPATALATDGFDVPSGLAVSLAGALTRMKAYPASIAAYSKDGVPYAVGERLRQPDLALTLTRIRDEGRNGFYRGETARLIVEEMRRGGGLITEDDLARYEAKERAAVHGTYRGYDITSMAPPSSGGVAMVEMLNILEGFDLAAAGHNSPRYVHLVTEAMRRAFLDRARYLGDPDFSALPIEKLTSKPYAKTLRETIAIDRATLSAPAQIADGYESPETTHFSVVDANGMAVSVTYTLEAGYGLAAVVGGAGFLLNNQMGDFNGKPGLTDSTGLIGTLPNLAQPGKRLLSSMTPSIVSRGGRLVAVVGSPGGRTIINTVLQVVLNVIDFRMNIQDAVNAPRFHHQWLPNVLTYERNGLPPETVAALQLMGHDVRAGGQQGTAHSIFVDTKSGQRIGAADPRDKDAGAVGY